MLTTTTDSLHCHDFLISGPRGVADKRMTATAVQENCTTAARIYTNNHTEHVWCPNTKNTTEYLQVHISMIVFKYRICKHNVDLFNNHFSNVVHSQNFVNFCD